MSTSYLLYHYWRSSSSWRVRWAFEHKRIPFEAIHVGLLNGESESEEHLKRNPAGMVPVLELSDGNRLTESLAIIRYLDEVHPSEPLQPKNPLDRARVWALAEVINSGTAPIQSLNVMYYHSQDPAEQRKWSQHWIRSGLSIYEKLVAGQAGLYSHGDVASLADLCLIPQCYNALRYDIDLSEFPTISRIHESAKLLEPYQKSHPDRYMPADFKP